MHLVTFYIFYTNICDINITAIKNHEFQKKEYTDLLGSALHYSYGPGNSTGMTADLY